MSHLEDGYTRIANGLLDDLARAKLSGSEFRVMLAVIRLTYGFSVASRRIKAGELMRKTGIDRRGVRRAVAKLVERGMLKKAGPYFEPNLGVQKYAARWEGSQGEQATLAGREEASVAPSG
ncbi:MAG: replication protein [bacterium]|nr:replication protein [bacterium]